MSPISSLPALFDQTSAPCAGGQLDSTAPGTTNMEQLLEKQGDGEAGVNIVEMLKALHALQKENQRLQEQILSLTAKKERLQVLNVQLSVPFPALPAALPATNGPIPGPYGLLPQAGSSDSLSVSKSPPGKNSLGLDNSLSTSSEPDRAAETPSSAARAAAAATAAAPGLSTADPRAPDCGLPDDPADAAETGAAAATDGWGLSAAHGQSTGWKLHPTAVRGHPWPAAHSISPTPAACWSPGGPFTGQQYKSNGCSGCSRSGGGGRRTSSPHCSDQPFSQPAWGRRQWEWPQRRDR